MISKPNPTTATTSPAGQRDPFPATIPEAFGFNSHYWDFAEGGNRGALEIWSLEKWEAPWGRLDPMADMGRSGFPLHRSTVAWNVNEPSPGTYNWKLQDALMRENARCGLRPLLMLAYGHPQYDASSGPSETCEVYSVLTPEGIAGYAAWARQVARRYRGRRVIYELWNEPNIHIFWPKPDADAYMALVKAAAPAIRAEDPTALIAGGALSNVWGGKWDELDVPYLTRCLENGLLEHVDILSFHPYNIFPPERIRDRQIIPIRNLIAQYAPAGKRIELLITEVGYGLKAGSEQGEIGFGLSNSAFEKAYFNELGNYLPRTLLSNLSLGVPTVWYELNSLIKEPRTQSLHSQNPSQPTLDDPDQHSQPDKVAWGYTPGVAAVRVLCDALRGYAFSRRLDVGDPNDDFVFELRHGQRRAIALWTAAETERALVLPLPAGAGTLIWYEGVGAASGVKTPVQWPANALKLTLNNWPKYLVITEEV